MNGALSDSANTGDAASADSPCLNSEFWTGRRVLVTGASGIVGSWLVFDLLKARAAVHCLIRDVVPRSHLWVSGCAARVVQIHGQLEDFGTLDRALNEYEIDTVFHLGAQTIVSTAIRAPLATLRSNVEGSWNVLEAARVHDGLVRRVIVASSDKAYGDHGGVPYTEDLALLGRHPYDVSKSCVDLIAQAYARTYGLPVAIARCCNVFGGGDLNWDRLVPGTVRSALAGKAPVVRSDGTFVREYLYVRDVARAYALLAESLDRPEVRGEAFNFGSGRPLTVLELVDVLLEVVGRTDLRPVVANTARAEIPAQTLCCAKSERVLAWKPRYDLRDAVAETVRWYAAYLGERP